MRELFQFPNPVNEVSIRLTAGIMAVLCWIAVGTGSVWLMGVIAATFLLRVASGPRLDLVSWVMSRLVTPRLGLAPKPTPGPPKRFAQLIGAVFTTAGFFIALSGFGLPAALLFGVVAIFATLESVVGFCAGCQVFSLLMRAGFIPDSVCEECSNIALRWERSAG
jgi:Domain of unknown function (DUF4395)